MGWKMVHNVARDNLGGDLNAAGDFAGALGALRPVTDRLPRAWQGGEVDRLLADLAGQAAVVNSVQNDVYEAVADAWRAEPAEIEAWVQEPLGFPLLPSIGSGGAGLGAGPGGPG